ncbi:RNA polymerase sigma-70 factor [Flaviaesturariibacter aridisoli]|uniref:RNA polymerase sigma-70 factor n=1 Tax=Flaviaesturariibacter aridisoli TaxID=2545761 RepID=UPI001405229D|nr:RNA polymerase sigma-70 factor [Flaviaesturariibacter aridisoli]
MKRLSVLQDLSTSELIQRIGAAGDAGAYRDLFLRYHDRLVAFAGHITHNRFTAEEVVSDVFLRLWINRGKLEQIANPNLYLYIAVRNAALNARDKERRHAHLPEAHSEALAAGSASDPEQLLLGREAGGRIEAIVNRLPAQCQLILRLVKEEGLRYKEVAALLGLSVKTVETQISIALRRIDRQLQPAGQTSLN